MNHWLKPSFTAILMKIYLLNFVIDKNASQSRRNWV